jgi:PAS domain S-box-containing protein
MSSPSRLGAPAILEDASREGGERKIRETVEEKLAATEANLRGEIAERERLEGQQRKAERGLREVRERFESAFGNAPIGMALIDMYGHWLQVNPALCRITGHTEDELKATTLRAITHPEDVDLDVEDRRNLLAGRIPSYQVVKRYRHAWRHDVWVLLTVSLVRDEKGDVLYVIMSSRKRKTSRSGSTWPGGSSTRSTTIF